MKMEFSTYCTEDAIQDGIKELLTIWYIGKVKYPPSLESLIDPFKLTVDELPKKNSRQKTKKYSVVLNFEHGDKKQFEVVFQKSRLRFYYLGCVKTPAV